MVRFYIVSTGWKCERTLDRCLDSVDNQTYKNWTHNITIDEGGDWDYEEKTSKRTVFKSLQRGGKMLNYILATNHVRGDTVICDLDLDDQLEPDALEIVAKEYEANPNLLMTYGSYTMESGRPARFNGPYESEKFRGLPWRGSHLKTFKASLFHRIKPNDFKGPPDGNWIMSGADMAMMYPMLEMAGLDRIKFIDKPIYIYNDLNPLNDHKTDPALQKRIERWLRSRRPYKRW